jgi:branched-subunit amino acid transport protein
VASLDRHTLNSLRVNELRMLVSVLLNYFLQPAWHYTKPAVLVALSKEDICQDEETLTPLVNDVRTLSKVSTVANTVNFGIFYVEKAAFCKLMVARMS